MASHASLLCAAPQGKPKHVAHALQIIAAAVEKYCALTGGAYCNQQARRRSVVAGTRGLCAAAQNWPSVIWVSCTFARLFCKLRWLCLHPPTHPPTLHPPSWPCLPPPSPPIRRWTASRACLACRSSTRRLPALQFHMPPRSRRHMRGGTAGSMLACMTCGYCSRRRGQLKPPFPSLCL